jgi:putative membrane protein
MLRDSTSADSRSKSHIMLGAAWRRNLAVVGGLSALTLLCIAGLLLRGHSSVVGREPSVLATFNAVMNALTVLALTLGYAFIRNGHRQAHRRAMLGALLTSTAFLVGYIAHHATVGSVRYAGVGWMRMVYFALLVPHVILAAVEVPLVLTTVTLAFSGQFRRHRSIARIALPVWLFVSASGVAVYVLLYRT